MSEIESYRLLYKCAVCGEQFTPFQQKTRREAELLLRDTFFSSGLTLVFRLELHNCPDGSIGIAKLIGARKEQ